MSPEPEWEVYRGYGVRRTSDGARVWCYSALSEQSQELAQELMALLASSRPPAQADEGWAERVREATTEVLDVNELTLALAEARRGSASWARAVHDSHEKLRSLAARSSAPAQADPPSEILDTLNGRYEAAMRTIARLTDELAVARTTTISPLADAVVLFHNKDSATLTLGIPGAGHLRFRIGQSVAVYPENEGPLSEAGQYKLIEEIDRLRASSLSVPQQGEVLRPDPLPAAAWRVLAHWEDCNPPDDLANYMAEPLQRLRDAATTPLPSEPEGRSDG